LHNCSPNRLKLAIIDDYQGAALRMADWRVIEKDVEITVFEKHLAETDAIVRRLKPFQIIATMRERTAFDAELLSKLPELRLLTTTGMHNVAIDLEFATQKGILVCGTGGPTAPGLPLDMSDVVELTWGLIFCLMRQIPQEDSAMRRGQWQTTVGTSLKNRTLGILGLGNLGREMARIAAVFGMPVIAWSQNLSQETAARHGVTIVSKAELFALSDVLTIHLKLGGRTTSLVGQAELEMMKPTAYLINTSRGPIVEEKALLAALTARRIAGAGLDVFDQEPLSAGHPLLSMDNVVLTPHLGYVADNTYRIFFRDTVEDVQAYLNGRPVRVMNPGVKWKEALHG
jgi:phosphoglycerate dehydrogenase-like enzyme